MKKIFTAMTLLAVGCFSQMVYADYPKTAEEAMARALEEKKYEYYGKAISFTTNVDYYIFLALEMGYQPIDKKERRDMLFRASRLPCGVSEKTYTTGRILYRHPTIIYTCPETKLKYLKLAADAGEVSAYLNLGSFYSDQKYGGNENLDYKTAVYWYKKAAASAYTKSTRANAYHNLSVLYGKGGYGINQNMALSKQYAVQACNLGNCARYNAYFKW